MYNLLLVNEFILYNFYHMLLSVLMQRLATPPVSLDELGDSLELLERMQKELESIDKQFEPLQDQFTMLEKYEVAIPEQVREDYIE